MRGILLGLLDFLHVCVQKMGVCILVVTSSVSLAPPGRTPAGLTLCAATPLHTRPACAGLWCGNESGRQRTSACRQAPCPTAKSGAAVGGGPWREPFPVSLTPSAPMRWPPKAKEGGFGVQRNRTAARCSSPVSSHTMRRRWLSALHHRR